MLIVVEFVMQSTVREEYWDLNSFIIAKVFFIDLEAEGHFTTTEGN